MPVNSRLQLLALFGGLQSIAAGTSTEVAASSPLTMIACHSVETILSTYTAVTPPMSLNTSEAAPIPLTVTSATSMNTETISSLSSGTSIIIPPPLPLISHTLTAAVPIDTSRGSISEQGQDYGNLIIRNNCNEELHLWSVGVRALGGYRPESQGYGTSADDISHPIPVGQSYSEPYRITCPDVEPGIDKYCSSMDKVAGQGVSIKISRTSQARTGDIFQFEYALVKDPKRGVGDKFHRMNYDVSLLDCAKMDHVSDRNGTDAQHDEKVAKCPGYEKGVAVTFDKDPKITNCPPVYCEGKHKCMMIYTWDRTREGEMSLACAKEYIGDMTVDLCVNGNIDFNNQAMGQFDQWVKTATNLPSGVSAPTPRAASRAFPPSPLAVISSSPARRARQESSPSNLDSTSCIDLGPSTLNKCYIPETLIPSDSKPTPGEVTVTVITTWTSYSAPIVSSAKVSSTEEDMNRAIMTPRSN